jgi:hypothetical protein
MLLFFPINRFLSSKNLSFRSFSIYASQIDTNETDGLSTAASLPASAVVSEKMTTTQKKYQTFVNARDIAGYTTGGLFEGEGHPRCCEQCG